MLHELGELLLELLPGSCIAFAIVMASRFFSFPHNSFIDKVVVVASYYRARIIPAISLPGDQQTIHIMEPKDFTEKYVILEKVA